MKKRKKSKSIYEQIRKPLPPPGRIHTPTKGKGSYKRQNTKHLAQMKEHLQ